MHVRHWENSGENTLDKYTVKMFPQAYRDIDKIYEQALLVSNYADAAIALAEKLEKAILSLEEQPYRGVERKYGKSEFWNQEISLKYKGY